MTMVTPKVKVDKEQLRIMFTQENKTMQDIADHFGTSLQNIHRYLKSMGLSRQDGGKFAIMKQREVDNPTSPIIEKHGCTKEQWEELRAMSADYKDTPLAAFNTFKNNFRNVHKTTPFELNLWQWWTIWKDSGHWGKHRRNPEGMYIMACLDKTKPFTVGNAEVIPFSQVLKELRNKVRFD